MSIVPQQTPTPWAHDHTKVLDALGVAPAVGLSTESVVARRRTHGTNTLLQVQRRSAWSVLIAQLKSILVLLLAAAFIAAASFGEWLEAFAILGVLVINTLLGFFTELGAVRAMDSLRRMGSTRATVRRNGTIEVIEAAELVPGDIVLIEGGDVVTADLRLIDASKLEANESTFTGESIPKSKSVAAVEADAPIGDRACILFKGTVVTRGSGAAAVVATGMASELGKISRMVQEAKEESTPLERRLNRLGRGLVWATIAVAALVAASGYFSGRPPYLVVETAIALAVAAVPEGLPIIATIALARGLQRMARHNALINRLSAVETLGATSVICTDKTGTLTENRIVVQQFVVGDAENARRRANEVGVLCNNAAVVSGEDSAGDPLEVALLIAGENEGINRTALLESAPEVREVAFDSETKMMATINGAGPPYRVCVKGAPESVLQVCSLDETARQRWMDEVDRLALGGQRVLGLAEGRLNAPEDEPYAALEFLGLVGLLDPPRAGIRETIEQCHRAGVKLVMVTGDHPLTAQNIARETGLVDEEKPLVVLGHKLEDAASLSSEERSILLDARIFARVSPKQKLDLIALHQEAGSVVAMTGDGVNDAPALRKADIGVAMGGRGTAAAKEAAEMVLIDDDLSTIPVAMAEGRAIFENIRTFVVYLMSCNLSEVLVVAIAEVAGLPLPLLPLQILFLNLVTDVFPALALGVGPGARNIMSRPPRDPKAPIIGAEHWRSIVGYGVLMTASVLTAFVLALYHLRLQPEQAVTVSFLTLGLAQLWHVFNMRRRTSGLVRNEVTANPWVWGAVILCILLLIAAVYFAPLASVLSIDPPGAKALGLTLGLSVVPLIVAQLLKLAWPNPTR